MKKILFILFFLSFISAEAQSERKIPNDSIPASAKANIVEKFKGYKVATVMLSTEKDGTFLYKIETRKDVNVDKTLIYNLVYDTNGKLISKKKDKEIYYSTAPDKETNREKGNKNHNNPFPRY